MACIEHNRPFDNYRTAITDPWFFFGREDLLKEFQQKPSHVHVLIGGRRLGKTSLLRAVEWTFLDHKNNRRAFPVFISLEVHQPRSLDNLRYILIRELSNTIQRWKDVKYKELRQAYRSFLGQISEANLKIAPWLELKIPNIDYEKKLHHDDFRSALIKSIDKLKELEFDGICFILDEAEYIVRRDWANDAWSYIRGLKDTDMALKPFFGISFGGVS